MIFRMFYYVVNNGSSYMNSHCFVSFMLSVLVWDNVKLRLDCRLLYWVSVSEHNHAYGAFFLLRMVCAEEPDELEPDAVYIIFLYRLC